MKNVKIINFTWVSNNLQLVSFIYNVLLKKLLLHIVWLSANKYINQAKEKDNPRDEVGNKLKRMTARRQGESV